MVSFVEWLSDLAVTSTFIMPCLFFKPNYPSGTRFPDEPKKPSPSLGLGGHTRIALKKTEQENGMCHFPAYPV